MKRLMMICLVLVLSGCNEAQKPDNIWGKGELPAEFQRYFGNGNEARLNFIQNQRLSQLALKVKNLETLNARQHTKLGETDIKFHGRIKKLEKRGIQIKGNAKVIIEAAEPNEVTNAH